MAGAGVPMRLSASEIDDDEEEEPAALSKEDEWAAADAAFFAGRNSGPHRRTSSGRSSLGRNTLTSGSTLTNNVTPPALESQAHIDSVDEVTPVATRPPGGDYFTKPLTTIRKDDLESSPDSEEEKEKREDELRRRGSVDDRAMTMSGVRLFVANPDLD
jgi:hypothetical protein